MDGTWEDFISLNSRAELGPEILGPVGDYVSLADGSVVWDERALPRDVAVSRDPFVLPTERDRELYYGPNHFNYWASGLRDWFQIKEWADANGASIRSSLDMGCASGRLIRHLKLQTEVEEVYGCDINRLHVEWVNRHLPRGVLAFQNTSVPSLPIETASLDLVTAFSVFTHIECLDTAWLMELRRILKPGGIAWLTVHGDRTWRELKPTWPLFGALDTHPAYQAVRDLPQIPDERAVFRWHAERSYSANIFYRDEYLKRTWGRYLDFIEIIPALPDFQDVVILRR